MPTFNEVGPGWQAYRNRKGFYGIVIMAGCDHHCRFNFFSAECTGATHDITAWEQSELKRILFDDKALPKPNYVIGDEAFTNLEQFLVPWSGRGLGPWRDSFNYHLSSMRQCIERAFGILTKRWGVFWRPLNVRLKNWGLVCIVAAKLHNFCIDEQGPEVPDINPMDIQPGDVWEVLENNRRGAEIHRPSGNTRRDITSILH